MHFLPGFSGQENREGSKGVVSEPGAGLRSGSHALLRLAHEGPPPPQPSPKGPSRVLSMAVLRVHRWLERGGAVACWVAKCAFRSCFVALRTGGEGPAL